MKVAAYPLLLPECPLTIKRDMYYAEVLVPQLIAGLGVVGEANEAWDWLLVPHCATHVYHSCVFDSLGNGKQRNTDECKEVAAQHVQQSVNKISSLWPYWNSSEGSDHLFVFSWDQASEVLGWDSPIRSQISKAVHLTTLGSTNPSVLPNFDYVKDVVIPTYSQFTHAFDIYPDLPFYHSSNIIPFSRILKALFDGWKWIHVNTGTQLRLISPIDPGWAFKSRPIFAYFRGTIIEDYRYSFGVRQYLRELGNSLPERYYVKDRHTSIENYWQELGNSRFCLCPSGWSPWSPRLFDCIVALSIPVVFADDIVFPFESQIPYNSFVIRINNRDMGNLDSVLRQISEVDVVRRQREMLKIRHKLVWPASATDAKENALKSVLNELDRKSKGSGDKRIEL
ncbi:hypothetical protein HDU79_012044 [Rhizoclosmatium sp. JEL0117]|nr:hypothetical protein HDU79_012044 [Rhizoclosmatium sp. JEL0117]